MKKGVVCSYSNARIFSCSKGSTQKAGKYTLTALPDLVVLIKPRYTARELQKTCVKFAKSLRLMNTLEHSGQNLINHYDFNVNGVSIKRG